MSQQTQTYATPNKNEKKSKNKNKKDVSFDQKIKNCEQAVGGAATGAFKASVSRAISRGEDPQTAVNIQSTALKMIVDMKAQQAKLRQQKDDNSSRKPRDPRAPQQRPCRGPSSFPLSPNTLEVV
jgi:lipopolysaccharide export system protein LptA